MKLGLVIAGMALVLGSTAASAGTYVDVQFSSPYWSGKFSGTDFNSDGRVSFGELNMFTAQFFDFQLTLKDISDFGDFDTHTLKWLPDASVYVTHEGYEPVYFSYDDGFAIGLSGKYEAPELNVLFPTAPVAEPETFALLLGGLGLVGAARRRKHGGEA